MKRLIPFLSIAILMAACSPNPNESATAAQDAAIAAPAADTAGLAQFQQWKAQNELATAQEYNEPVAQYEAPRPAPRAAVTKRVAKAPVRKATRPAAVASNPAPAQEAPAASSGSGEDVAMNTESAEEAKAETKEGWSKAAKGAVIGGAGGAAAGAVIYKKNRALGAAIGGVLGGAGGYVIGRKMDKKDGRVE